MLTFSAEIEAFFICKSKGNLTGVILYQCLEENKLECIYIIGFCVTYSAKKEPFYKPDIICHILEKYESIKPPKLFQGCVSYQWFI